MFQLQTSIILSHLKRKEKLIIKSPIFKNQKHKKDNNNK